MFTLLFFICLGLFVALIIGLVQPFPYWPKSKTKPTRKRLGMTFGGLLLVCFILLVIYAQSTKVKNQSISISSTSSPAKIVETSPTKITHTDIQLSPIPTKTPEQILQGILNKYGKNSNDVLTQENGQWYIVKFTDATNDVLHAKAISRNFIFDVYATKLPIRDVTINVGSFSDKNNFQESLCNDLANQQPQITWTQDTQNDPFGDNWYDFLNKNAKTDPSDDCQTGVINNI